MNVGTATRAGRTCIWPLIHQGNKPDTSTDGACELSCPGSSPILSDNKLLARHYAATPPAIARTTRGCQVNEGIIVPVIVKMVDNKCSSSRPFARKPLQGSLAPMAWMWALADGLKKHISMRRDSATRIGKRVLRGVKISVPCHFLFAHGLPVTSMAAELLRAARPLFEGLPASPTFGHSAIIPSQKHPASWSSGEMYRG